MGTEDADQLDAAEAVAAVVAAAGCWEHRAGDAALETMDDPHHVADRYGVSADVGSLILEVNHAVVP